MHKDALGKFYSDRWFVVEGGEDVTKEFLLNLTFEDDVSMDPTQKNENVDKRKVFVVHGRDSKLRDSMFAFLRAIGLEPIEWNQAVLGTGKATPYVGEILDYAFSQARAVVVLLSPDDVAFLREELRGKNEEEYEIQLTPQARQNVLFESGIAMGRDENRTVIIEIGKLRPFSDIAGRHKIIMDNTAEKRKALAQRLEKAGCKINLEGDDWLKAGDFTAPQFSLKESLTARPDDYFPGDVELELMVVIAAHLEGGRTINELSPNFSDSKQKLTWRLSKLVKSGYVECDKSSFTRWGAYYLTDKGREYLDKENRL